MTIGGLAREQLKKAAKTDFGNDTQRWRNWIEKHVK
jgi:hypothetical protein